MAAVDVAESVEVALPPAAAYDALLPLPLPELFSHRFVAIPRIREVRGQDGPWGTLGQTRTIVLADGGTMREELTEVRPGEAFGYAMTDFRGPLKALVASAEGRWAFAPAGGGTRITWSWRLHPRGVQGRLAMPLFAWMWHGYARRALADLDGRLAGR